MLDLIIMCFVLQLDLKDIGERHLQEGTNKNKVSVVRVHDYSKYENQIKDFLKPVPDQMVL